MMTISRCLLRDQRCGHNIVAYKIEAKGFSICTVTFYYCSHCTVEQYVDKCIQSIPIKPIQNLEIILVDDGATDR